MIKGPHLARLFGLLLPLCFTPSTQTQESAQPTYISIENGRWHLNNKVTYPGTRAEGLLMNVRMINSTFEDRHKPAFDPTANTEKFISRIPEYADQGVLAFTLCLQGGFPGYEGALNSAFNPDGSLRESYLLRLKRVIRVCDRHGLAVILGCYYQRQDQILEDADAVRAGVVNVVKWIEKNRFHNVVLEIANEYSHPGFDHPILKTPEKLESSPEVDRSAKESTLSALLLFFLNLSDSRELSFTIVLFLIS